MKVNLPKPMGRRIECRVSEEQWHSILRVRDLLALENAGRKPTVSAVARLLIERGARDVEAFLNGEGETSE